jgi:hypothetical protein
MTTQQQHRRRSKRRLTKLDAVAVGIHLRGLPPIGPHPWVPGVLPFLFFSLLTAIFIYFFHYYEIRMIPTLGQQNGKIN